MTQYPIWRVLIAFSLCPAIGGFWVLIFFIWGAWGGDVFEHEGLLYFIWGLLVMFVLFPISAVFFYFVPAFVVAIFYVYLKLERNWKGYLLVGLLGSTSVLLWYEFVIDTYFFGCGLNVSAGAVSSLIMARLVLPIPDIH